MLFLRASALVRTPCIWEICQRFWPCLTSVPRRGGVAFLGLQVNPVACLEFMVLGDFVVRPDLPRHDVQILGQACLRVTFLRVHELHAVLCRPQAV